MLVEPERTAYDLRFRVLRFPVRVHPWFWIVAALMGSRTLDMGAQFLLMWVAVVFVSILVHELGHAVAFRRFGSDADIVLYSFGGLAIPTSFVTGRARRIAVSLAGPVAGFVLGALVYGSNLAFGWGQSPAGLPANGLELYFLYRQLIWVNLLWGLLNLLPVYPARRRAGEPRAVRQVLGHARQARLAANLVRGGALVRGLFARLCDGRARHGRRLHRLLAVVWFPPGSIFTALLFGVLAYQSYQLLQRTEWSETHWDDRPPVAEITSGVRVSMAT